MNKIVEAIKQMVDAAKCDHDFDYHGTGKYGAQVRVCLKCKCRFTSYPGSEMYDETLSKT